MTQTILSNGHRVRCEKEATRDVIFLFQRRVYHLHGLPDGWETSEGYVTIEPDEAGVADVEDSVPSDVLKRLLDDGIPLREFAKLGLEYGDWDHPCVTEEWLTEGVWLDREEAEQYGKRREYNYVDGWRVYGVCAEGDLALLLQGKAVVAESPMYFLQNLSAGYVGDSPLWWAKGGNGYTIRIDNAEEFTESEVRKHLDHDKHKWRAYPVEYVRSRLITVVSSVHCNQAL